MPPPHILWLTEHYPPNVGGMAQSCDRITHHLRLDGATIDVAHFCRPIDATEIQIQMQQQGRYLLCPIPTNGHQGDFSPAHSINLLWNLLQKDVSHYTHVVAFGGHLPLLAAPIFAQWLGIPLLVLLRGNDFDTAIFTPKKRDILMDALSRAAAICVVDQDKQWKVKALFPNTPVHWVANGIDGSQWMPVPSDHVKAKAWRETAVGGGQRVLAMFGHIKQKKGGLFFLETLLDSGMLAHFHLLFVGDVEAPIMALLRRRVDAHAYSIFPFTDRYDLIPYYLASDWVVIASYYDGMPNVMLEGCALGKPFLASATAGMKDVLSEGVHGFLFHPGDKDSCRLAIHHAADCDAQQLAQYGHATEQLAHGLLKHTRETLEYRQIFADTEKCV